MAWLIKWPSPGHLPGCHILQQLVSEQSPGAAPCKVYYNNWALRPPRREPLWLGPTDSSMATAGAPGLSGQRPRWQSRRWIQKHRRLWTHSCRGRLLSLTEPVDCPTQYLHHQFLNQRPCLLCYSWHSNETSCTLESRAMFLKMCEQRRVPHHPLQPGKNSRLEHAYQAVQFSCFWWPDILSNPLVWITIEREVIILSIQQIWYWNLPVGSDSWWSLGLWSPRSKYKQLSINTVFITLFKN